MYHPLILNKSNCTGVIRSQQSNITAGRFFDDDDNDSLRRSGNRPFLYFQFSRSISEHHAWCNMCLTLGSRTLCTATFCTICKKPCQFGNTQYQKSMRWRLRYKHELVSAAATRKDGDAPFPRPSHASVEVLSQKHQPCVLLHNEEMRRLWKHCQYFAGRKRASRLGEA